MARLSLMDDASETEIIAVASGKGGLGKSTVAVNVARALARRGHRAGIMALTSTGSPYLNDSGYRDDRRRVRTALNPWNLRASRS